MGKTTVEDTKKICCFFLSELPQIITINIQVFQLSKVSFYRLKTNRLVSVSQFRQKMDKNYVKFASKERSLY